MRQRAGAHTLQYKYVELPRGDPDSELSQTSSEIPIHRKFSPSYTHLYGPGIIHLLGRSLGGKEQTNSITMQVGTADYAKASQQQPIDPMASQTSQNGFEIRPQHAASLLAMISMCDHSAAIARLHELVKALAAASLSQINELQAQILAERKIFASEKAQMKVTLAELKGKSAAREGQLDSPARNRDQSLSYFFDLGRLHAEKRKIVQLSADVDSYRNECTGLRKKLGNAVSSRNEEIVRHQLIEMLLRAGSKGQTTEIDELSKDVASKARKVDLLEALSVASAKRQAEAERSVEEIREDNDRLRTDFKKCEAEREILTAENLALKERAPRYWSRTVEQECQPQ